MDLEKLQSLVSACGNIVFFGGAGTSTESGIPDFRSADGLYAKGADSLYTPEQVLSRSFFLRNPETFYTFYKSRMLYPDARPNAAHAALAKLERRGQLRAVVTQNIDGLHQDAGSRRVLELHGSVRRNSCMDCGSAFPLAYVLGSGETVPRCDRCGGLVKPDVVLYEEPLDPAVWEEAVRRIEEAELLIVAGTSLTVHPAAGLIRHCRNGKLLLINQTATPYDAHADYLVQDRVGRVLEALTRDLA